MRVLGGENWTVGHGDVARCDYRLDTRLTNKGNEELLVESSIKNVDTGAER